MEGRGETRLDSKGGDSRASVVVIALQYLSHVVSLLHLARELARSGLSIAFLASDENIERLKEVAPHSGVLEGWDGLDIRLVGFKMPRGIVGRSIHQVVLTVTSSLKGLEDYLRGELACQRRPTCVIADVWIPGTMDLMDELKIPTYIASTFPASEIVSYAYIPQLVAQGILKLPPSPFSDEAQQLISIPGLPLVPISEISVALFPGIADFCHMMDDITRSIFNCRAVLINTYYELEHRALDDLQQLLRVEALKNHTQMPAVWAVGPTFSSSCLSVERESQMVGAAAAAGAEDTHPCIEWLDSQPASSVLYVAFGNDARFTREQIFELAVGLESSGQAFLGVLHPPINSESSEIQDLASVLPPDFAVRNENRGLLVQGWLPQLKVLAHPAIGGFLTHCGWNSILESLWMGVPMLTWPMIADQPLNARCLVNGSKVALEVSKGANGFVERKEVERSVRALFGSEEGMAVRKRAAQLRASARASVEPDGSSTRNIRALVRDIATVARASHT